MVNIGLALKDQLPKGNDTFYSSIDLNALPVSYQPAVFRITNVIIPVALILGIGALAYGGFLIKGIYDDAASINQQIEKQNTGNEVLRLQNSKLRNDVTNLEEEISKFPGQADQIEAKIGSVEALGSNFNSLLEQLSLGLTLTDNKLKEVVDLLPVTIDLYDIGYSDDSVTISGVAQDEDDIFGYARALRSSELFDEVTISSINGVSTFEFNMLIK